MKRYGLKHLSAEEKRLAEENHKIVFAFLRDYGYSAERYYGVCVIGFLKGIQRYCEQSNYQDLFYLCWNYMRAEMENHFKVERTAKRVPMEKICSLDAEYAETESLYNLLIGKSVEEEYIEKIQFEEMMENLSEIQRVISEMKMSGFSNKEIFLLLEISSSKYYREINGIKAILEKYVA